LEPLTKTIDDYLRIEVTALTTQVKEQNPFFDENKVRDIRMLLEHGHLQIFDFHLNLQEEIARILNEDYYSYNSQSLAQSENYHRMKIIGFKKFGIHFIEVFLQNYMKFQ